MNESQYTKKSITVNDVEALVAVNNLCGHNFSCPFGESKTFGEIRDLYAAAPNMYNALKRVEKWGMEHGTPEIQGVLCDVYNAVAKAEGN